MAVFEKIDYILSPDLTLSPMDSGQAQEAGRQLAAIDPWLAIDFPAHKLAGYLAYDDPSAYKFSILFQGQVAGVICLRYPWLKGPYLELLGLYPDFQGQKIGGAVMAWYEKQGAGEGQNRNLWLVASDFNHGAISFYEHLGFKKIAKLDDLSVDGVHDILMRKTLF